jgi:DNA polymerase III subunit delta'
MAEDSEDPRETSLHPRFAKQVVGHRAALSQFKSAFSSGKLHHAWLISGPRGIGKATLAYHLAGHVLGAGDPNDRAERWIHARSHPDLFVLERQLADRKPVKLKTEISVEDARGLPTFFGRTSGSGGWRVAIVDAADDLNRESANALLKQVEEPPPNCVMFIITHQPGRILRTLKSRCLRLPLGRLSAEETAQVLHSVEVDDETRKSTLVIADGSPGKAIELATSTAAKAFQRFPANGRTTAAARVAIVNTLSGRAAGQDEFIAMSELLLGFTARMAINEAGNPAGEKLSKAYSTSVQRIRETTSYNLDRKLAIVAQMMAIDEALKPT